MQSGLFRNIPCRVATRERKLKWSSSKRLEPSVRAQLRFHLLSNSYRDFGKGSGMYTDQLSAAVPLPGVAKIFAKTPKKNMARVPVVARIFAELSTKQTGGAV